MVTRQAEKLCMSSELDLTKDFWSKARVIQKDCMWRKIAVQEQQQQGAVTTMDLQVLYEDLNAWEIVLGKLQENQDLWSAHIVKPNAAETLHRVTSLSEFLAMNQPTRKIWMHPAVGVNMWVPLWQRFETQCLKIEWNIKQVPLQVRNALMLCTEEQCKKICPAFLVGKMPEDFPTYIQSSARKPSMLKKWWSPGLVQDRCWDKLLKNLLMIGLDGQSAEGFVHDLQHCLP